MSAWHDDTPSRFHHAGIEDVSLLLSAFFDEHQYTRVAAFAVLNAIDLDPETYGYRLLNAESRPTPE